MRRCPVELSVKADRYSEPVEATAYYVVAEALTNVAKYAQASKATVRIAPVGDRLIVDVEDDGVGGADTSAGTGLRGLADRLAPATASSRSRARRGQARACTPRSRSAR